MIAPSAGFLWLALAVVLPAAAIAGFVPTLFLPCALVLAACAGLAMADAALGVRRAETIVIHAPESMRFTMDVPATLPVTIENHFGRELRLRAAIPLPEGVVSEKLVEEIWAPPGASHLDWPTIPRARGDHPVEQVQIETPSPLGLWAIRDRLPIRTNLRVYPNLRDRATATLFLRTADSGARPRARLGKGREFENLRHYIAGDNYEDIDWKATARRGFPVVKLYQVEHAQEVYAILDSSRLSAREGILESYIGAALHLALVAQKQGDRFGLAAFSNYTQKFLRARGGLGHFRLCRETIYKLKAECVSPDFREIFTTLQLNLRRRALLVFFTSLDDPVLAETFAQEISLLARRHLVLVNVTETRELQPLFAGDPPETLDALYQGLAGQILRNRMREVQLVLQNKGVKLALVNPAHIKTQVASQYLEVKRRQVL
jgi:uncharacterized protein (DUF58 family)